MKTQARCPTCFRTETWDTDGTQWVDQPGGSRRPADPAFADTWHTLAEWRRGGPVVVGTCEACGQSLVSDTPGAEALTGWRLETPQGDLVLGEWITGPDGTMSVEDADAWIQAQVRADKRSTLKRQLPMLPFIAVAVVMVIVLFLVWLWAGTFFLNFVWQGMAHDAFDQMPGA